MGVIPQWPADELESISLLFKKFRNKVNSRVYPAALAGSKRIYRGIQLDPRDRGAPGALLPEFRRSVRGDFPIYGFLQQSAPARLDWKSKPKNVCGGRQKWHNYAPSRRGLVVQNKGVAG